MSYAPPTARRRLLPFVLGGVAITGAVVALALVLAGDDSGSQGTQVAYENIGASPSPSSGSGPAEGSSGPAAAEGSSGPAAAEGSAAPAAEGSSGPRTAGSGSAPVAPPDPGSAAKADDVEAECRGYQVDRKWSDLAACADRLQPLAPARAEELKTLAQKEAPLASRVAAIEAALRDRNLKRARSELDQLSPTSSDHASLKRKYEAAEAQAITYLANDLESVKDSGCEEYNALLAKQRPLKPPRVISEASRRVPCVPVKRCDADALVVQGRDHFAANRLPEAFAAYDAAHTCKPSSALAQKAFVVACNLRSLPKSRSYWKRLTIGLQTQALGTCLRNGITEAQLNGP